MFHNRIIAPILILWTGSWPWTGFWTWLWMGSWHISFGWRLRMSLCRLMLHWRTGMRSALWPWFRLCFSFSIFFRWTRHRPGSAPRLFFGSAAWSWTPARFQFWLALWSRFSTFWSGTWSIFTPRPRFRAKKRPLLNYAYFRRYN